MTENLKKTLNIDGTEYNINAVYSDEAGKVTNPLIVKRSGNAAFNFDGSTSGQTIDYVPTEGGTFHGKVYIEHANVLDKDLGSVTDNELINYDQIKHLVYDLTKQPLYSWESNQLTDLKNVHSGLSGLNVVVGTTEEFKAFKRLMGVPDITSTDEETRYYGLRISSSTPYTEGHVDYRTRTNSTYTDVYLPSYGYYNTLSTGIIDLSKGVPVTTIREKAFESNKTIEMVMIPESITKIESYAFRYCSTLKSIKLPSKLERITTETFNGCTSLKSIVIGKNVKKISREAFNLCSNLKTVYYEGTEDDWLAFNIVDTVTLNDDSKQISSKGNAALTEVYTKSKKGEDGYSFVFNYIYEPDFIDLPCLYICTDLGTNSLNIDNINKMFLKMPNTGIFVELSRGATYLESALTPSAGSYTYEGLAEIIAKINKRLEGIGGEELKIADSHVVNATILDTSHELIPDDDFDIESVPTVQELDARLESIEDELAIYENETRLDAIEDGDTRAVKEARKVSNSLTIKLTDEAATEETDKFTYDGSVAKTVTIKTTDNDITLKKALYTFAPIGVAQKASNYVIGSGNIISSSNPGKLGDSGDSLKAVFDRVFGTETPIQPTIGSSNVKLTITHNPTTKTYTGIKDDSTSTEFGATVAAVSSVTYTITLSNNATAKYGYKCGDEEPNTTANATFYYPAKKAYTYDGSTAQLKITLPSNKTVSVTSGTLVKTDSANNILYCDFDSYKEVKFTVALDSTTITTDSQTRYGTVSAEVTLGNAQTEDTNNALPVATTETSKIITKFLAYKPVTKSYEDSTVAVDGTNIGTGSNKGKLTDSENAITVSSGYVPYTYCLSASLPGSLPTSNRTQSKPTSIIVSGGSDSTYLYIFVPFGNSISSLSAGPLAVPFTQVASSKSYEVNNEKTATYKVYKTVSTVKAETFTVA